MSDPNENRAAVEAALAAVQAHPMCGRLEDTGGMFTVWYPAGDFPVHGVRASQERGKRNALDLLIGVMERHWRDSYPSGGGQ